MDWTKTNDLNGIVRSMTELKAAAAAAPLPATTAPAAPLTPETIAFLQSIGIDPSSEDVRVAHESGEIQTTYMDEPMAVSLESLARAKKKNPVIRFVATRAYIAKLKKDFDNVELLITNYEPTFLTKEERMLVGKKVAQTLLKG